MRRSTFQEILSHATFVVVMCAIGIFAINIIGCGEEVENPIEAEDAIGTIGNLRIPDTAPGAPKLQVPEGTPTVKSVSYYSDWQLTKPLIGTVSKGKTIFIKVEFSEGMKLVVADDKHARPILYRRVNGKLIRFNIANFGAKGEDFVSGDAKPVKTKASFICKYIVQPGDTGEFVFAVGKLSTDLQGNLLPAFYTHKEKLRLGKPLYPTVKSVDYYSDWQLTKPLTGTITSGTLVYTKIVFSEGMEHVVSDGAGARPEMYYRIGSRDVQHNIVPFGATGKHYTHGDAKPIKNQATYVGKYRVKSSDYGTFTLVAGKKSANKKGEKLAGEYVHAEVLRIPEPEKESTLEDPVTHKYIGGVVVAEILPPSAWVPDFPRPLRTFSPPESNPGDFVGQVCMPAADYNDDMGESDNVIPIPDVTVTITKGPRMGEQVTTDEGGYYHFPDIAGDELYLRVKREYLEPKEVIVSRTRPTMLQEIGPNRVFDASHHEREGPDNAPGIILMGVRWPDAVRFILEEELLPYDLLCVMGIRLPNPTKLGKSGDYGNLLVRVFNFPENKNELSYGTLAHELAHARQHAVAISHGSSDISHWEHTPEGKAYAKAWKKDLKEVPSKDWIGTLDKSDYYDSNLIENAAEFCSYYWGMEIGYDAWNYEITRGGSIQVRAPNRFKWCQEHLNKRYD